MDKIIIICGPTASSKTASAVRLAKKLNTEVVSADSLYVYKQLNVGTAKPTIDEMQGVVHHLIDVCEPNGTFSVGDYRELAKPIIDDIINRRKIPIVCGGTGFYINSILYNYSYGDGKADLELRKSYFDLASEHGNEYVFNILKEKDYETSLKLHPNDLKRVIRALEICANGRKKSDIKDDNLPNYDYKAFTIDFERKELYDRIDKRVDIMINNGLLGEVKGLLGQGLSEHSQSMQGIGYKEIIEYLNGSITLQEAVEKIKLNTRHYAKRQITFFKKLPNLVYLKPDTIEDIADRIIERL